MRAAAPVAAASAKLSCSGALHISSIRLSYHWINL